MDDQEVIDQTAEHVRAISCELPSSHDWWHVQRVWRAATAIAADESVDRVVVELAALLHDIADWKFHGGDLSAGPRAARIWLESRAVRPETIEHVCAIVGEVSFKGAGVPDDMHSLEGKIVQDADRLDAMGAIGLARAFAYGGQQGQRMHDPQAAAKFHETAEAYFNSQGTTIQHFSEKPLILVDRMHTPMGRRIALRRHAFMEAFLSRFLEEWDGADFAEGLGLRGDPA